MGAMVVTSGPETDGDRTHNFTEARHEAIVIRRGRHYSQTLTASAFRAFDQHLLAVLGHIDSYRHRVGSSKATLGHGGLSPKC